QDGVPDMARIRELGSELGGRAGAHPLIGVGVEDPLAAREVERVVARRGEVVDPSKLVEPGPGLPGDLPRAVGGPGVHDHHLVRAVADRAEALAEEALLVPDDEHGRQQDTSAHRAAGAGPDTMAPPRLVLTG